MYLSSFEYFSLRHSTFLSPSFLHSISSERSARSRALILHMQSFFMHTRSTLRQRWRVKIANKLLFVGRIWNIASIAAQWMAQLASQFISVTTNQKTKKLVNHECSNIRATNIDFWLPFKWHTFPLSSAPAMSIDLVKGIRAGSQWIYRWFSCWTNPFQVFGCAMKTKKTRIRWIDLILSIFPLDLFGPSSLVRSNSFKLINWH